MKTIAGALACVLVGSLTTVVAEDAPALAPAKPEPFSIADFTWLNGNSRQKESILDSKYVTGEVRADVNYVYDFNNPKDHTLVGSSEIGRVQEFQVQQFGVGGDLHWSNVRARLMTRFGMYSTMTPRNDASPSRGQWQLDNAYRYLSELYAGYHIVRCPGSTSTPGSSCRTSHRTRRGSSRASGSRSIPARS